MIRIFDINPDLDYNKYSKIFATDTRVQIRDVLTTDSAQNLRAMLAKETKWGLAWQAGFDGPHSQTSVELAQFPPHKRQQMVGDISKAMQSDAYAFSFAHYPMVKALQDGWDPGGPHEILIEHLNDEPFLSMVRRITGMDDLIKADGQATLYAPGHFLAVHSDSHVLEGWKVAYVLNIGLEEWRPDWGGYLNFFNEEGEIIAGFKPRYNSLNLFAVPQLHNVSYVPPFAPQGRMAVTGWLRNV
jgi:SM-20-related protein